MRGQINRVLLAFAACFVLVGSGGFAGAGGHVSSDTAVQPVWYVPPGGLDRDILILPPEHGQVANLDSGVLGGANPDELDRCDNSYTVATRKAVDDWQTAINTYGSTALTLNAYVLSCDAGVNPNPLAYDIVVVSGPTTFPVLGFAVSTDPCIAEINKFGVLSYTFNDYYNVATHEIGHCLGLDHSEGFPSSCTDSSPDAICHDVMEAAYHHLPGFPAHRHCPSNLNVAGIDAVYSAASQGVMPWNQYQKISC